MKKHAAFTMIELIFVIVVMGIIGKFGVEFLAQTYKSFIFSSVNNHLQEKSAYVVEFLAARLQYRIKDSVIARTDLNNNYTSIGNVDSDVTYKVLEWVEGDIDGFRGNSLPFWSGIADLDAGSATGIASPATDTSLLSKQIESLSYGDSDVTNTAIYFIGSNNDIDGYGWDGNPTDKQLGVMHPVKDTAGTLTTFTPREGATQTDDSFAVPGNAVNVYEYYKLSWTANAVAIENYDSTTGMGDLYFYYDYQPWDGETFFEDAKRVLLMEDVSTFKFLSLGSILKIQVCTKSNIIEEYSLCKEKTIF